MRRGLVAAGLSLALALALGGCSGGQQAASPGAGPAPAGKKKQRRPGVNEWFTPARGRFPVDLAGTAAQGLAFTEYRRGRFRVWQARGVPGRRAEAVWQAVRSRSGELVPLLVHDEVFDEGLHGQLVSAGGAVERQGKDSLAQALVVREKELGERAARMRAALAAATPNESYRHTMAVAEHLFDKLWADPEERPFDLALTVYRGPIEDVTPFLVSGAGFEPGPSELAAALRHWRQKYGATPRRWQRGRGLELAVDRPPRTLAEQRELAWQFYLMCPAQLSGLSRDNERPDELLVRVAQPSWDCAWYVE